ncbi:hypothetical protein, partial [uncultured Winogradskyella sp.]|uniref:hypothetical protein n=1 Tax=uncultured Winogradskyella sp. TaxID=395353 RepID=UPI00261EE292
MKFIALNGLLFFAGINICLSQTINGVIYNKPDNTSVTISTRTENSSDQIKEFKIVQKDSFQMILKKHYDTLRVYCDLIGYKSKPVIFIKPNKNETLNAKFFLEKDSIQQLEEVLINARKRFYKKKDTIGYIASEYLDGTERKVKDLLKKLPQIEVSDKSGIVKYKGKEIETITLDGDNLFGSNYSIATKNINVDIIKAVEAIDNYEENELLKGISDAGKVSLNLVLKDSKTDLSGTIEIGVGTIEEEKLARGLSSSLLAVNKKHKSFFTITSNNIGVNNSPFSFESGVRTSEQRREKDYLSYALINSLSSNSDFGNERGNINDQNFGNFNSLIPINKKLKIKLNGFYLKDNIVGKNLSEQTLFGFDGDQNISIFDNTTFSNQPNFLRGDIDIKYRINKKSLLSITSKIQNIDTEKIRTTEANNNDFDLAIDSENTYLNNAVEYTYKLNDSTVFQSRFHYSNNSIPQNLTINTTSELAETSNQFSEFTKEYFSFSNYLIGKKGRLKYGTQITFYNNSLNYGSSLVSNTDSFEESRNNLNRTNVALYSLSYASLEYNQWRFSTRANIKYLKQALTGFSNQFNLIINPSIAITYTLGENKTISLIANYNKEPLQLENSFSNGVLVDNRTQLVNTPSLELQESYNIG